MAPIDLEEVIAVGETYTVEFRGDAGDDELVEAVVCLGNGDGGLVLIGVDDSGAVVGAGPRFDGANLGPRVAALVANKTSPALAVAVAVAEVDAAKVVVVQVPRATSVVATTSGRYLRRAVDVHGRPECRPMAPHEVQARASAISAHDISTLPISDLAAEDLDQSELDRFRSLAAGSGDSVLSSLSDADLLVALGLVSADGALTLGAALLFGTPEVLDAFAPTHAVVFQVLDSQDGVVANRNLRVPLIRAMLEILEAVKLHNPEEEVNGGPFRLGLPRFSEAATRELIANALVHRDYSVNGQIRVAVEDTTLSVSSPGGFPEGITVGNLLAAPPQARNPRIADAFKRAGLVERTGRGINRVFRHQLALGRPQPDYSRSSRAWVEVRVAGGSAFRDVAAFVAAAARDGNALDLRTLQALHAVRADGHITSATAADLMHAPVPEARAVLDDLVGRGLLEAAGEGRGRTYRLAGQLHGEIGQPPSYQRGRGLTPDEQAELVLAFAAEHGSIGRGEAAELCGLAPERASRLLRRMAAQETLRMTGARRTARYSIPQAD